MGTHKYSKTYKILVFAVILLIMAAQCFLVVSAWVKLKAEIPLTIGEDGTEPVVLEFDGLPNCFSEYSGNLESVLEFAVNEAELGIWENGAYALFVPTSANIGNIVSVTVQNAETEDVFGCDLPIADLANLKEMIPYRLISGDIITINCGGFFEVFPETDGQPPIGWTEILPREQQQPETEEPTTETETTTELITELTTVESTGEEETTVEETTIELTTEPTIESTEELTTQPTTEPPTWEGTTAPIMEPTTVPAPITTIAETENNNETTSSVDTGEVDGSNTNEPTESEQ